MAGESSPVEKRILAFLERYNRPFLQGIGLATRCRPWGSPSAPELATYLAQPANVRALYDCCGAAERWWLLCGYLSPGSAIPERALWEMGYGYTGDKAKRPERELLLKGLLLLEHRGPKPIGLPDGYSYSIYGNLHLNPLVEPLVREEQARSFKLVAAPDASVRRSTDYRVRERELYRLLQWLADTPLPLTLGGAPRQREVQRMGQALSLDADQAAWLLDFAAARGLLKVGDDALSISQEGRSYLGEAPAPRLRRLGRALNSHYSIGINVRSWRSPGSLAQASSLLTLLPTQRWVALSDLSAWLVQQRLPGRLAVSVESLSKVLVQGLQPLGWVDLGYEPTGKQLVCFYLTSAGAVALGLAPALPPEPEARAKALVVKPDLEVVATLDRLDASQVAFLHRFSDGRSGDNIGLFRLTRESLYRSARAGHRLDDVRSFLVDNSERALPENVRLTLEGWWAEFQGMVVWEDVDIAEDDGVFHVQSGPDHGATVVDYRARPLGNARWRSGSLLLSDGGADIFLEAALATIATRRGEGWHLDSEKLAGLRRQGDRRFRRVVEVLQQALTPWPLELDLALKAFKGEYGALAVSSVTALVLPTPELASQLLGLPWFRKEALLCSGRTVLVPAASVDRVKKYLVDLGFKLEEEPQGVWERVKEDALAGGLPASRARGSDDGPGAGVAQWSEVGNQLQRVAQLRNAIEQGNEVNLWLQSRGSKGEFLTMVPKEVYQSARGWVLDGFCEQRGEDVTVSLERLQSISVVTKHEDTPKTRLRRRRR